MIFVCVKIMIEEDEVKEMLLEDKLRKTRFSPSEQTVADYILSSGDDLQDATTVSIARETYTSPATIVRVAKKLEFDGFNDFKDAWLDERKYLQSSFQHTDANMPFTAADPMMRVVTKITHLEEDALKDTLALMDHDTMRAALNMMNNHPVIDVVAVANLNFLAQEFAYKMNHIGVDTRNSIISNTLYHDAMFLPDNAMAIALSYSGASGELLKVCRILKQRHIPVLAITSYGGSHLADLADLVIPVCTRERSYTKIGAFTSLTSMSLVLDCLYALYFADHFETSWDFKLAISEATELRDIDNIIIKE